MITSFVVYHKLSLFLLLTGHIYQLLPDFKRLLISFSKPSYSSLDTFIKEGDVDYITRFLSQMVPLISNIITNTGNFISQMGWEKGMVKSVVNKHMCQIKIGFITNQCVISHVVRICWLNECSFSVNNKCLTCIGVLIKFLIKIVRKKLL